MRTKQPNVTIKGEALAHPRHICCFFDSRDQQYDVLVPYFSEGLANGERVMAVMDDHQVDDHYQRLSAGGVDVPNAREAGRLCAFCTKDVYIKDGVFSKTRMLGTLMEALQSARDAGHSALRTCGDMTWLSRNVPGTEEVLEYESEVNAILDSCDATFMCVYDLRAVSASAMRDIMNTHPHILMGDVFYTNMDYLSAADYQNSLIKRRSDPDRR